MRWIGNGAGKEKCEWKLHGGVRKAKNCVMVRSHSCWHGNIWTKEKIEFLRVKGSTVDQTHVAVPQSIPQSCHGS